MSYTIQRVTSIDLAVLRRIFDDCETKTEENYTALQGKTSDEKFSIVSKAAQAWATQGMCLSCSKDGTVVFMSWGQITGTNWKIINFLAGKDSAGSRAYLYDTDWLVAMRDFHLTMSSVYTTQEHLHTTDASAKTHFDAMVARADADAQFTHASSGDSTVDVDFTARTLSEIE
jgi:hypothetical protein|tara:strand:+ start:24 stop:542 length:519 start_codon:yes stop_codon:yes gene_type:complete